MEHRTVALLFQSGKWIWSEDFHHNIHKDLGQYVEVYFAKGWQDNEVDEVIQEYYATNLENLF